MSVGVFCVRVWERMSEETQKSEVLGNVEVQAKEQGVNIPTSPSNVEIQLKKELDAVRNENDALRREMENARNELKSAYDETKNLKHHVRALLDKYAADQRQSEMELSKLDQQAKDVIERIQMVANKLEEDNALLLENLKEAIK